MAEYQCINCGNIRSFDLKNTSGAPRGYCSCPVCGYRMFLLPYDRTKVLTDQIKAFLCHYLTNRMSGSDPQYKSCKKKDGCSREPEQEKETEYLPEPEKEEEYVYLHSRPEASEENAPHRESKDADAVSRFPDAERIMEYVCKAEKTEELFERLDDSLGKITSYLHTPFAEDYKVTYNSFLDRIKERDSVLEGAMSDLGIDYRYTAPELPCAVLSYSETPDSTVMIGADEALDLIRSLIDKIGAFISDNHIYGIDYREISKITYSYKKGTDPLEALQKGIDILEATLKKRFFVDIMSDGSAELKEMFRTVWNGIKLLLSVPVFEKKYVYHVGSKTFVGEEAFCRMLLEIINRRYDAVYNLVSDDGYWRGKDESILFGLYKKILECDADGFLGGIPDAGSALGGGEAEEKLRSLVGLGEVKRNIQRIKAYVQANSDTSHLNLNMCFCGNPGTGKTEVARIIAGILCEIGVLENPDVVEVDRSGLVSNYVGETAIKTAKVIDEAMGGVLFIDEAYSLVTKGGGFDYGHEAIATLIKAMEDHRGEFCVIFAGYRIPMQEMLASNQGFRSRIQFEIDFPDYTRDELGRIMDIMLARQVYLAEPAVKEKILDITDAKRREPGFANAREIRNILDRAIMNQNLRTAGTGDRVIGAVDVDRYVSDSGAAISVVHDGISTKVLTADEELDALVGLDAVKKTVRKIRAFAKRHRDNRSFGTHMCFCGNPGTGKTEVARLLSRILYEAGVLPEGKLTETDAHGLIGKFVGETAVKTEAKINEAMGGVLFIDEAYSLVSASAGNGAGYGDEAIAVLLKYMEDYRGRFCVIFAGYPAETERMISSNPGLKSRIQFRLDFPDYSEAELREIAVRFAGKAGYEMDDSVRDRISGITEYLRGSPDFANARTVRNILDQVILNQNLRTEDCPEDNKIILQDVEDYISEQGIMQKNDPGRRAGFF